MTPTTAPSAPWTQTRGSCQGCGAEDQHQYPRLFEGAPCLLPANRSDDTAKGKRQQGWVNYSIFFCGGGTITQQRSHGMPIGNEQRDFSSSLYNIHSSTLRFNAPSPPLPFCLRHHLCCDFCQVDEIWAKAQHVEVAVEVTACHAHLGFTGYVAERTATTSKS